MDSTSRQQTEEIVRGQAALLDLAFDAILVRDFRTDAIQFWNHGAEEMYGFSRYEVIGRVSHDVLRTVHPIPIDEAKAILARTGRWAGELLHTTRGGVRIVVESRWAVQTEGGQPVVILETNRDISELKEATAENARLYREAQRVAAEQSAILAQMADAVAIVDPDGTLVFLNEVAKRLTGRTAFGSLESALREGQIKTIDGRPYPLGQMPLFRALRQRETTADARWRLRHPDGTEMIVQGSATPVMGENGELLGAVSVFRDVTADVALEQHKEEFLSAAAHDLKAPLANLKGLAQLLLLRLDREPDVSGDQLRRGLSRIEQNADRMTGLINELLDISRLQMGKGLELYCRPMDLVSLVSRTVAEHGEAAGTQRLRFQRAVPELIGTWDGYRLERVMGNLLSNAIKYSANDTPITITVEEERNGPGWAVIAVEDRGIGIPAADLPHIFERFHRGRNVGRETLGTGIGLAGARQIVEQHGGTIEVMSEEGDGTTFTVRLPLAPASIADARSPR